MREVRVAAADVTLRQGPHGVSYLRSTLPLGPYPARITERLDDWAERAPDRVFLAERDCSLTIEDGASRPWRTLTYADALARVRRIAQALIARGLSVDRPIVIVSGNSLEHALLAFGAMYAGVVYAPVAPAYSIQTRDFGALRRIVDVMRPGLVFASDGALFERALDAVLAPDVEVVTCAPCEWRQSTPFAELETATATDAVDDANRRVDGDTIAKVLFTSGSTGRPKGVVNTQRMLCANQEMLRTALPFLADEPPVICDWSPWNHTAGGNHNIGLVLYNGGTLYIDDGRPAPGAFDATLRNLREVACTAHFAVPRLYEMLMPHLRSDAALRETFFRRLKLLFYAAAGLGQRFWDELRDLAVDACGEQILIMSGFGSTETAPFALGTGPSGAFAGLIGVPAPGLELKLAPVGDVVEGRVKGPSITPGYWRDDQLTATAFDEEGFFRLGDAMRLADERNPQRGVVYEGRIAEDFKLSTGTWVRVGPLRARILAAAGGLAQDVVIAGHDRAYPAAIVVPNLPVCRERAGVPPEAATGEVVAHPVVVGLVREALERLARESTGSSTFVSRAVLVAEPLSLEAQEVTVKGSVNQKAVLVNRRDLVDELYADPPCGRIIKVWGPGPVKNL